MPHAVRKHSHREQKKSSTTPLRLVKYTWRDRVREPVAEIRKLRRDRRSVAMVGAARLIALLKEIGEDGGHKYGWKVAAALEIGLPAHTAYNLLNGVQDRIGIRTIDLVCKHIGCQVGALLDDDYTFRDGYNYSRRPKH
jgi:DNA-binding Xre family transcriptional regulator